MFRTSWFSLFHLAFTLVLPLPCASNPNFKANLICTDKHMIVHITAPDEFSGVVYTEGSYRKEGCHHPIKSAQKFQLTIPYDGCKTTKENGHYVNVLVVQHHERLTTKDDAAFKLTCDTSDLQRSKIVVTESMYMVHDKNHYTVSDGDDHDDDDNQVRNMKSLKQKGSKTIILEKDVLTYVSGGKNGTTASKTKVMQY